MIVNFDFEDSPESQTYPADLATPLPAYTGGNGPHILAAKSSAQDINATESPLSPMDSEFPLERLATRDSRHDRPLGTLAPIDIPPPYTESLPAYTETKEPATLVKRLYKFGFLFPPIWLWGAFKLVSPSVDNMADGEELENEIFSESVRLAEVKWAKKCLTAFMLFFSIGATVGLLAWAVSRI